MALEKVECKAQDAKNVNVDVDVDLSTARDKTGTSCCHNVHESSLYTFVGFEHCHFLPH